MQKNSCTLLLAVVHLRILTETQAHESPASQCVQENSFTLSLAVVHLRKVAKTKAHYCQKQRAAVLVHALARGG